MKKVLFLALGLTLSWFAHATTYYVSHEGNDYHSGTSAQQAWRSIKKVNAMMKTFRPGDRILFRRGDRFPGGVVVTTSGTSGQPIVFGAYGSGAAPIIDGFRHLRSWQSVGDQTWKTTYDSPQGQALNLLINHRPQPIGRYPNQNDASGGYLAVSSGNGQGSLSSTALRGGPWHGADVVVRSRRWILDRVPIIKQQGTTLTLAGKTRYYISPNYGFFIVNHRKTLDQQGEWAYVSAEQAIYLRSSRNPNTQGVMTAHVGELFSVQRVKHIVIEQLELWGAAQAAVFIKNSKHVTVKRCRIFGSGRNGATVKYSQQVLFSRNRFEDTNNNGLSVQGGSHTEVADNTFLRTAMIPGLGGSGNNTYCALQGTTHHLNVHRNTIDQVGYNGIAFVGDHINVQYNVITNFCQFKDDGGGIYTWEASQYPHQSVQIKNNIIGEGGSATVGQGTPGSYLTHVSGIYLDNYTNGVKIMNNTVYNCGNHGIYFHNAYNSEVKNNLLYNNRRAIGFSEDDVVPNAYIRGITAEYNVLFARQASQELLYMRSIHGKHFRFGTINRNQYYSPLKYERIIHVADRNYRSTLYNLAQWQQASPYDHASRRGTEQWPAYQVKRYLSGNLLDNANFHHDTRGWQYWSSGGNGKMDHTQTSLDGGSMAMRFAPGAGNSRMSVMPSGSMGPVKKGERYVLRYSLASDGNHEQLNTRITTRRGTYQQVSNTHYASPTVRRQEVETFFTINTSIDDGALRFGVSENDQRIYVDNTELRKVETQAVNHNDYVRFFANDTPGKKNFPLPPGQWRSTRGRTYRGSVTLDRAHSIILLRQDAAVASRQAKSAPKPEATTDGIITDKMSPLQVYPNPLYDGPLTVTLAPAGTSEVLVYDMTGQLLLREFTSGQSSITLPKDQLGHGARLVKVVSGERSEVQKVVIR